MESYKIHKIALPTSGQESYIAVLNNIFLGRKGYETSGDEESCILRTRELFKCASEKHKAPAIIPTIFRNHSERGSFIGLDHSEQNIDPKFPPEETFVIFTFADDIYANIIINFSKGYPEGKQKPFLLHDQSAKIICLSQKYSAEDAFEEALSSNAQYYADDIQMIKNSIYVDPDHSQWRLQEGCMAEYSRVEDNEIQFIVDVSVIYPENIWSTVLVVCYDCGKFAETTLCHAVKEASRREIWHNIVQSNVNEKVSEKGRCVIRLPMTNSLHTLCSFREGLLAFTPLTHNGSEKPSLFVRVRLTFYTNEESRIGHVLHNHKWS